jgi:hypothetical protein
MTVCALPNRDLEMIAVFWPFSRASIGYVLEIDTISRRAPIPSTIVAVWSSEILAKANRELTVTGIPSLSRMAKTRTGVRNDVSRG